MKKWTKGFIKKNLAGDSWPTTEAVVDNARKAQRKLKLPAELWLELHREVAGRFGQQWNPESVVAMGIAIGWAEHEESVK